MIRSCVYIANNVQCVSVHLQYTGFLLLWDHYKFEEGDKVLRNGCQLLSSLDVNYRLSIWVYEYVYEI